MIGAFIAWTHYAEQGRGTAGYIITGNGCHVWVGNLARGYGMVGVPQSNGKRQNQYVHRVRYEREIGPIPEGMELDHFYCENKACCNPAHVRPVTHLENVLRGNGPCSTNAAKTHCKNGHPLSGENLVPWRLSRGERRCWTCHLVGQRLQNARRRKRIKKATVIGRKGGWRCS